MGDDTRLRARRSLGQHFLHDARALDTIAARCELPNVHVIVEIGPGKGALTDRLVERLSRQAGEESGQPARLILIEKDRRFIEILEERFAGDERVKVIEADAAGVDYSALIAPDERAVAVGNLPYNAASPIYFRLLRDRRRFARLVLMFQREVADRLVSPPGSRVYGAPSVATTMWTAARIVLRLPPKAFVPPPRVHSAVVQADPRPAPLFPVEDDDAFISFVRGLFRYRRKTVANGLRLSHALGEGGEAPTLDALLHDAGVDGRSRAEKLDVETLWRLYRGCGGR